ncbi:hypothetical protein ACU8M5_10785 [Rhizobium leguminosarum]
MRKVVGVVIALLAFALFVARAPTAYTGEIPFISDYVPLKLNAVYLVVFVPVLATLAALYIWAGLRVLRRFHPGDRTFFAAAFFVYVVLLGLVALQYFIVLAPQGHCDRLPNYSFLWTSAFGDMRIVHCMSGTEEINKFTPFYLRQQILQSWFMLLCPVIVAGLFLHAWQRLQRLS